MENSLGQILLLVNMIEEDLKRLAEWLRSDEGKRILEESQNEAEETNMIIDSMTKIDPKILKEPFDI